MSTEPSPRPESVIFAHAKRISVTIASSILIGTLLYAHLGCGGGGGGSGDTGNGGGGNGVQQTNPNPTIETGGQTPANKVVVEATAVDSDGDAISLQWRATDGTLANQSGTSVEWTLPGGAGLHFIYVLASDQNGGYTEKSLGVSVDDFGVTAEVLPSVDITAPNKSEFTGGRFRSTIRTHRNPTSGGYAPDIPVQLTDPGSGQVVASAVSDLRGEFTFDKVPSGTYLVQCSALQPPTFTSCGPDITIGNAAISTTNPNSSYFTPLPLASSLEVAGNVKFPDGTLCGTDNAFFSKTVAATSELLNSSSELIGNPVRINAYGGYYIRADGLPKGTYAVRTKCEGYPPVTQSFDFSPGASNIRHEINVVIFNHRPAVSKISAKRGATIISETSDTVSAIKPSDLHVQPDRFLAYKGKDDRISACQYYLSIGAVTACDADGKSAGSIGFEQWKQKNFDQLEILALYVNSVDLNLTRHMHGTTRSDGAVSYYVCNSPGPKEDIEAEVDRVVADSVNGRNRVACVAMEYGPLPGTNNDRPFTRFLVFGPSGRLLPSVNLDGYGEKFVPGACVSCHGGGQYAGKYQADGTASPDLGSHFLPFDTGNYLFSSDSSLTEQGQTDAIRALNNIVLATSPTTQTSDLINHWYENNSLSLDKDYVPQSWINQGAAAVSLYNNVIKTSCRTCHVALDSHSAVTGKSLGFDDYSNFTSGGFLLDVTFPRMVCGDNLGNLNMNHAMPNSAVTFNRFWNSRGHGSKDQPLIFGEYFGLSSATPPLLCSL